MNDDRQESDYIPTAAFEPADIAQRMEEAESFVETIRDLTTPGANDD
jgi:hypothetical protein